jgi:hypothetical protein
MKMVVKFIVVPLLLTGLMWFVYYQIFVDRSKIYCPLIGKRELCEKVGCKIEIAGGIPESPNWYCTHKK